MTGMKRSIAIGRLRDVADGLMHRTVTRALNHLSTTGSLKATARSA